MSFLVDTDIASAFLKNHPRVGYHVTTRFGSLNVSAVTAGELLVWARRAKAPPRRMRDVRDFLSNCHILMIDAVVAETFGQVRADLLDRGRTVGVADLLNAAVALVHNLTLVTHNVADYAHVPGLSVVDWMA